MGKPAYLSVKNYEQYQHYKDRSPPWIKLYRCILHDFAFRKLSEQDRFRYIGCLILACETENKIPYDEVYLSGILGLTTPKVDLSALLKSKLLLAHGAITRRVETEERRVEKIITSPDGDSTREVFDEFWEAYPKRNGKRIGKEKARELFNKLLPDDQKLCILAARNYGASMRAKEGFIRDPERFLKADYWREWIEPETPQANKHVIEQATAIQAFLNRGTHDKGRIHPSVPALGVSAVGQAVRHDHAGRHDAE